MKALSIRQPWAWLIVEGHKPIENRDWPANFRGPLLIHASSSMTRREYDECKKFLREEIDDYIDGRFNLPEPDQLDRGGIIGVATLSDCLSPGKKMKPPYPVTVEEMAWFTGAHGFVLRNPEPLEQMIPYKGALGFFDVRIDHLTAAGLITDTSPDYLMLERYVAIANAATSRAYFSLRQACSSEREIHL